MNSKPPPPCWWLLLICFAVLSSCHAQESPRRMMPGATIRDLVVETPRPDQDGIVRINFSQVFKQGVTEWTRVGTQGLAQTPQLPTGYAVVQELVFAVKTDAVSAGPNLVVFNLPSVKTPAEFEKLEVLRLENDELNPSGKSWLPVTVLPGGWDEESHRPFSKERYDAVTPDFNTRRLAAIVNHLDLFVIAAAVKEQPVRNAPFTKIEVTAASSPREAAENQQVVHTIRVTNQGPNDAAEVDLREELGTELLFVSAEPSQGVCRNSTQSSGRVLCYLGALPRTAAATVTVKSTVRPNLAAGGGQAIGHILEVVFKEQSSDLPQATNDKILQFNTTLARQH